MLSQEIKQRERTRSKYWLAPIVVLGLGVVAAGCGSQAKSASPSKTSAKKTSTPKTYKQPGTGNLIEGATPYAGTKNLDHYIAEAKASPKSVNANYHAAVASFVNGKFPQAESYYKAAIALDPTNGTLWNNLGNIYNYTLKEYSTALPDYQKAVKYSSTNPTDWLNLINCETSLKNTAAAKGDVTEALKDVPKDTSNPYYEAIYQMAHPKTTTSTAPKS